MGHVRSEIIKRCQRPRRMERIGSNPFSLLRLAVPVRRDWPRQILMPQAGEFFPVRGMDFGFSALRDQ